MKILEPVKFRNLELKNRLVWLPAVTCLADEVGFVTDALIERHVARAKGGFGLIDVEACGVLDRKSPNLLRICDDKFIPGLKEMTDAVHAEGCKMTVQLIHYVKQSVRTGWKQAVEDLTYEDIDLCKRQFVESTIRAREAGFDRSMILSYGQDDRVCAFTSLFAMLDVENAKRTGCCLLVDKEEIGSVGATGMHSRFFENTVAELVALTEGESELKVRRALANSRMLSSDVSAAYDPMFAEAFEKRSAAFFTKGLAFNKFTGSRGKSGSNDANAEYLARLRKVMDDAGVTYQFAELGKVDVGGGGTIAYIMANYGMEVIDSGVAVLSMHAPYEVSSKADVYEAVKGYRAFLLNM